MTYPEPPDGTRIEFQEYGRRGGDLIGIYRDDSSSAEAGWPVGDGGKVWCEYGTSVPITWQEVLEDPRLAACVNGTRLYTRSGWDEAITELHTEDKKDAEVFRESVLANPQWWDGWPYAHPYRQAAKYLEQIRHLKE